MRDAELHLPQAFIGALLASMLLVAALLANSALAATARESAPSACTRSDAAR
jgi:hypothetical protein